MQALCGCDAARGRPPDFRGNLQWRITPNPKLSTSRKTTATNAAYRHPVVYTLYQGTAVHALVGTNCSNAVLNGLHVGRRGARGRQRSVCPGTAPYLHYCGQCAPGNSYGARRRSALGQRRHGRRTRRGSRVWSADNAPAVREVELGLDHVSVGTHGTSQGCLQARKDTREACLFGAGLSASGRFCFEAMMASFVKKRLHVTEKLCALVALQTTIGLKPVTSWSSAPDVYGPGPIPPGSLWNRSAVPKPRWCGSLLFSRESVASRPRAAVRVSSFRPPIPGAPAKEKTLHKRNARAPTWDVGCINDPTIVVTKYYLPLSA